MSKQQVLDLEELFDLNEEEPENVVKEKPGKKKAKGTKEGAPKSDQKEQGDQPTNNQEDEGHNEAVASPKPGKNAQKGSVGSDGWHTNIIGEPPKRAIPNPYFQGVIAKDGLDGKVIYIPFDDIKRVQRQVYVDDIYLEQPTMIHTIYRVSGTFLDVVARITEEQFYEIQKHKDVRLDATSYSYVSDHRQGKPKRNYVFKHEKWPTENELKEIDKREDEIEWHLLPWHEKEKLKGLYKEEEFPETQDEADEQPEDISEE